MPNKHKRWTKEEREQMLHLYINGYSYHTIAEKFNTTYQKAKNVVRHMKENKRKECMCFNFSENEVVKIGSSRIKLNYCPKCGRKL